MNYQTLSVPEPAPRVVKLDREALYHALDRERRARRIRSMREVARQAGIPGPSTMVRIGQGEGVNADTLVRLMTWLGTTDIGPFVARIEDE